MSKIAFFSGTFSAFSGIERQVQYQAEEFVSQGHSVTVFAFEADMKPTADYRLVILGMPKNLFFQRLFRLFYPFIPGLLSRHLRSVQGFDRVISHQYPLTALAARAKKEFGSHYTYFDHGIPPANIFPSWSERLYIRLFTRFIVPTIRSADRVVCISKFLQSEMKRMTGLEAEVVYDKYNKRMFNQQVDRQRIRQKFQLGDRPVVLYIGRLSPHKNLEDLITAFKRVDPKLRAVLIIVGKPTFSGYEQKLRGLANQNTIFAGYAPEEDIPAYYGAATVYATTSLWEGFDLPIVEAHACGKAAVMYNIGPHPEIAGPYDRLVKSGDIVGFASALESLLRQPL